MRKLHGPTDDVLEADLSTRTYKIYHIKTEERRLYLGAKGLGLKLLFDRLTPGVDPLGPENILAFMPGVLLGTGAPCTGRFHAISKSPLTGIMTSSSCGGPFGMQLKTAGWDGLLITGKADLPTVMEINADGVSFRDAEDFWGMETSEAQDRLSGKKTGVLVIGPAGENGVRFANIRSGDRYLGRGGLGAVMGAKNLKAVVARGGNFRISPADEKKFKKASKRGTAYINRNEMTGSLLRRYGTGANVNLNNAAGILPVRNFSRGRDDQAYEVSGEMYRDLHASKFHNCKPCTIRCGHKGTFGEKQRPIPEFETISLMGTNLGVFDRAAIAEWNHLCGELGMDTISTGGTLAWVMEATEKGLLKTDIRFGQSENVPETLADIGYGRGFGKEMGMGSRWLSEKYGGEEFAIQVKGLEMAGYDPRGSYGHGLAYAVANRGACHLSSYMIAPEVYFGLLNPFAVRAKARFVKFFESLSACINSLQTCQFTMYAYVLEPPLSKFTPNIILKQLMQNAPVIAIALMDFSVYTQLWSAATGISITNAELLKAGDRIHVLERYMNTREGISGKDDVLPGRMLNEGLKCGGKERTVPLEKMLNAYYRVRGYDAEGMPKKETLEKLGIL